MAVMETYAGLMLAVLLIMVLLLFWRRKQFAPQRRHAISDEAAREIEGVLADYTRIVTASKEKIIDTRELPETKETIKQYLQISIGVARLNGESANELLKDYYLLAHFQDIDRGDERVFPLAIKETHETVDGDRIINSADNQESGEQAGDVERKYLKRVADETSVLEKELETFLRQKRLF